MNRREFFGAAFAAAATDRMEVAVGEIVQPSLKDYVPQVSHDAPPRSRHPYRKLDWSKAQRIRTTSHGKRVWATTDKPAKFKVITAHGVVKEAEGTSVEWALPKSDLSQWGFGIVGREHEAYARVKAFATDGSGEIISSQPFMLDTP